MLTNCVKSREVYEQLTDVMPQFRSFIESPDTWQQLQTVSQVHEELADIIKASQADSTSISLVPELISRIASVVAWMGSCPSLVPEPELQSLTDKMIQRFDDDKDVTGCRRFHNLANILDPRFKGSKLSQEEKQESEDLLRSHTQDVVQASEDAAHTDILVTAAVRQYYDYLTNTGLFASFKFDNNKFSSSLVYWKAIRELTAEEGAHTPLTHVSGGKLPVFHGNFLLSFLSFPEHFSAKRASLVAGAGRRPSSLSRWIETLSLLSRDAPLASRRAARIAQSESRLSLTAAL